MDKCLIYSEIELLKINYISDLRKKINLINSTPILKAAFEYIIKNLFNNEITIASLRKKFLINDNNFSREFKNLIGITPKRFIVHHRLKFALDLMCNYEFSSSLTIHEVSNICGFNSNASFTKSFKIEFFLSPKVVKRNQKKVNFNYRQINFLR
jgi:AraC-like DNA-binding protein